MRIERIYNDDNKTTGRAMMAITSTKSQAEIEAVSDILDAKGWKDENTMCAEYTESDRFFSGEWSLSWVVDLSDLKTFKEHYKLAKKAVK